MSPSPSDPVLPIVIVPLQGGKVEEPRQAEPPDLRHWQIEEFLRQTGKADNTQRTYRGQLVRFAAWCDKSWLDVTPSAIGKYRRDLELKGLKPTSINHALNTLRSFYQWLRRGNGYPMNQPLPTDAIDLERQPELQADHIEAEDLSQLWAVLELEEKTRIRDRAIIAVLSHGLRASEASALNVGHWNGKILKVHRSKGQNVSEVPLSREARSHLEAYLEWRRYQGGRFEPLPESPLFLAQDPKSAGQRLGYKGLHRMVKKLGAIDLFGSGFTEHPAAIPVNPGSIRQHLLSIVETWIGEPIALVGASLGGAVAIDFALHHPSWVRSLALIDSVGFSGSFPVGQFLPNGLIDLGADWLYFRKRAALAAASVLPMVHPTLIDALRCSLLHQEMPEWREAIASFTRGGGYSDLSDRIAQVTHPTLILWGKADDVLGTADATRWQRAIADSQLIWIEDAGHMPHFDQPPVVANHLLSFMQHTNR